MFNYIWTNIWHSFIIDPHLVEVGRTYGSVMWEQKSIFFLTLTVCCAPGIFLLVWILSHVLGLSGCVIQPPEGLCLHRTKKHRQTANTHAFNLSGSRQLLCGHIASNKVSVSNCNTECVWGTSSSSFLIVCNRRDIPWLPSYFLRNMMNGSFCISVTWYLVG